MRTWELWPHQKEAVDNINEEWSKGKKAICCQLPTGSGKTRVIRTIVDEFADEKKKVYILAHRNTLVDQLSKELTDAGLQHGVIKSGFPYVRYRVQVASMQTIVRRLDKLPEPSLIIVDECFPTGSMVNGAGEIENIKPGDTVLSYDEKTNTMVNKKVLSTMKRELKDDLICVTLVDDRKLVCTKNHPIMTNRGWVKAENIGVEDGILCSVWKANMGFKKNLFKRMQKQKTFSGNVEDKQKICKRKNVEKQSNEQCRNKSKSFKNSKRNEMETTSTRREWSTNADTTTSTTQKISSTGVCSRMCNTHKNGKIFRLSNLLQIRFRKPSNKISNRNRRIFSLFTKKASSGQEKIRLPRYVRVDNIKVQKFGSRQWIESMHGSNYVYNFEVEDTHTYVVNNCIVHNCHHLKSKSYLKVLDKWPSSKVLGMTATPQRQDGKSLDVFDTLISGPSMKSLIAKGKLSDYDYYAPENIDMSGVTLQAGEYNKKQSQEKVDKAVITGNVIEHYKRYADHKPAICCCISIAHSEHVAAEFRSAGYKALAVNSHMKQIEVKNAINGLSNGSLEILTQCDMLGEGVDIPGVECLIQLRPTHSLVIFMQQCGRSLRAVKGKDKAIILDHVGNWERFGLPDDNREWSLQGKKKKDKGTSKLKRCPECLRPVPISARECPYCGYLWAETREKGKREIEEKEGQLIAIKSVDKPQQQELIIKIARGAHNLKQAIKIAKENGFDHRAGFVIWTRALNHKAKDIIAF